MEPQMLTVEIHDISPVFRDEINIIQEALHNLDVNCPILLVVPNYKDDKDYYWDLREDTNMVDWLTKEQEDGSEIIQHGYTHRAPGPPPPGLRNAFIHYFYTGGCAEFAHLSSEQAKERLKAGRYILSDCGLQPQGFIAPAWQMSPEAMNALSEMGYRFTAFVNQIIPLIGDHTPARALALTYDAPCALLAHGKQLLMRGMEFLVRSSQLLRVALHPADVRRVRPFTHVIQRIQALMEYRRLITYAEWLSWRNRLEPF